MFVLLACAPVLSRERKPVQNLPEMQESCCGQMNLICNAAAFFCLPKRSAAEQVIPEDQAENGRTDPQKTLWKNQDQRHPDAGRKQHQPEQAPHPRISLPSESPSYANPLITGYETPVISIPELRFPCQNSRPLFRQASFRHAFQASASPPELLYSGSSRTVFSCPDSSSAIRSASCIASSEMPPPAKRLTRSGTRSMILVIGS